MKDVTRRAGLGLMAAGAAACASPGTGAGGLAAASGAPAGEAGFGPSFSLAALWADLDFLDRGAALQTGTAGDLALMRRVEERLAASGFEISRQSFDAPGFDIRRCEVEVGAERIRVVPQAIVRPTGPGGVEARLHPWRGAGDDEGVRDAIVVLMLPFARHSQLRAPMIRAPLDRVLAGRPAAVVLVTTGVTGETIYLNAAYEAPHGDVPIAVVGPKPGAGLIAAAERRERGRLVLDGDVVRRTSANVWGRITGRGPIVVVSTPRTGWVRAVAERGPGLASFLALAAWAPAALPGNDLLFVTTCAHEYDNAGGVAFIRDHAPKPRDTHLWVHLGAGFAARDWHETGGALRPLPSADEQRYLVGSENTLPVIREAFAGQPGLEAAYPASAGAAGELGEILSHGYQRVFGAYSGHPFHHTEEDGIQCTDPALVQRAALAFANAILRLAPPGG